MPIGLLRVLRMVIRADSDPARQALFANLMQAHVVVRLIFAVHERIEGTLASAWLVAGYGFAALLRIVPPRARAQVLAVARHANARRQVSRVTDWIGAADCTVVDTGIDPVAAWSAVRLVARGRIRRIVRLLGRIDAQHGFLVGCRAASALAWYARSRQSMTGARPGAVLVSSDSNPEEVGFIGAARGLGIPTVFVSHAYPTPLTPPLDFSLSILEGEAAVRARQEKGPIRGDVLLAGVEGESAPLDAQRFRVPHPVIGIFTPKAVSWPTLASLIDDCRRYYHPRQVVIRWHPSMLEEPHLHYVLHDLTAVVESPRSAALSDVARQCDWVIADENSNVHLPVLKLGIPTVAVRHLGIYPDSRSDQYGFVAHGVILPPLHSIADVHAEDLAAFFDAGWAQRFHDYDASYLQPADAIAARVRAAVRALFEPVASTAARVPA